MLLTLFSGKTFRNAASLKNNADIMQMINRWFYCACIRRCDAVEPNFKVWALFASFNSFIRQYCEIWSIKFIKGQHLDDAFELPNQLAEWRLEVTWTPKTSRKVREEVNKLKQPQSKREGKKKKNSLGRLFTSNFRRFRVRTQTF